MTAITATTAGWCLQRLETQRLLGPSLDGHNDVEFVDDAQTWPSRLAARLSLENRWEALQLEYKLVPASAVPRRPLEPSLDDWAGRLLYATPLEAAAAQQLVFVEMCDRLEGWMRRAGIEPPLRPGLAITCAGHKWGGLYRGAEHEVVLVAPYAMLHADYDICVAHEVVHAYQAAFSGRASGHGDDFYGLMRHAARVPVTRHTHSMDPNEAAKLGLATSLWWRRARESGLAASASCRVHWDLDQVKPTEGDLE